MRPLLLIIIFFYAACHSGQDTKLSQIKKFIPDSTNSFYAREFYKDYKRTRQIEALFNLPDISDGTKNFELRFWSLSSFYDPQSIYILIKNKSDWNLKVIKYNSSSKDSITAETNMTFRDDFISKLNLERYWSLPSQSEMKNGDSFGCTDGNTILLELSDFSRYKYIGVRCPEMHVSKDSTFYWVNSLNKDLRSLAKEN
jgi:hypothetical protein